MKKFALTTALVLTAAAPALAQSQLELSLGVPAGKYTVAELAQLKHGATADSVNERRTYIGGSSVSFTSKGLHSARAADIFARIREESREDE